MVAVAPTILKDGGVASAGALAEKLPVVEPLDGLEASADGSLVLLISATALKPAAAVAAAAIKLNGGGDAPNACVTPRYVLIKP